MAVKLGEKSWMGWTAFMKISQVPSLRSWSLFINCFVKQWWERQLSQRAEPIWRSRRAHPCNQTLVPQASQGHSHCCVTLGCCVTCSPCLSLFHYNRKTIAALLSDGETPRAKVSGALLMDSKACRRARCQRAPHLWSLLALKFYGDSISVCK